MIYQSNLFRFAIYMILNAHIASVAIAADDCIGPTSLVKVKLLVNETSALHTFNYTIINNTNKSIYMFRIGEGATTEMRLYPNQNVDVTSSPPGWSGMVTQKYEGLDNHINWHEDNKDMIEPNETTSGFEVTITAPPPNPTAWQDVDGKILLPLDLKTMPYQIYFTNHTCIWGIPEIVN